MSVTLKKVRERLRMQLRELDDEKPVFGLVELDHALATNYLTLDGRLPASELYTASAFTITAGSDTFNLTSTISQYGPASYAGLIRIQLNRTGDFLRKLTGEELDRMLRDSLATIHLGIPRWFCLWEDKSQVVQGRVYPGAQQSEVCNVFANTRASDIRDFTGAGGISTLDDVSILFSDHMANGLMLYTAADLLTRMIPEDLAMRHLNPRAAEFWMKDANDALYKEYERRNMLSTVGRQKRFVM